MAYPLSTPEAEYKSHKKTTASLSLVITVLAKKFENRISYLALPRADPPKADSKKGTALFAAFLSLAASMHAYHVPVREGQQVKNSALLPNTIPPFSGHARLSAVGRSPFCRSRAPHSKRLIPTPSPASRSLGS